MTTAKKFTLQSTLSETDKLNLTQFIINTLNDEELSGQSFPRQLDRKIVIRVDGVVWILYRNDYWSYSSPYLYVGTYATENFPQGERLAVLLTLSQMCESSEALTRACALAITR